MRIGVVNGRARAWIAAAALASIALAGLAVRRHVVRVQHAGRDRPLPFTAESALQYRAVKQVYLDGARPAHDPYIEYPDGIRPAETDTAGAEYVFALLARAFPVDVRLADRLRWLEAGWFCLGIPLMGLWVRRLAGRWSAGLMAAFLYAVGLGAVQRSTGLELSHENFALPWLLAHLALDAGAAGAARRGGSSLRRSAGLAAGSGVCLGLALATWDLVQFYAGLRAIALWAAWCRRPDALAGPNRWRHLAPLAALVAVGLWSPYFRRHGWLLSPILLVSLGVGAASIAWERGLRPGRLRWLLPLAPLLLLPLAGGYLESYGHFGELLAAKLRFLNVKPADPAQLTFNQRILWTPALHSATWRLAVHLFPAVPLLTLCAVGLWWRRTEDEAERPSDAGRLLFYAVASSVAFILFVRFSVFAALFLSAGAGVGFAWALERGPRARRVLAGLWFFGAAVEGVHGWQAAPSIRRSEAYAALEQLTAWLKERAAPSPVLADFGLSASVLAYGDCPILLHPKFETERIRRRVEEYGTHMFKGTERSLHDWAVPLGARYVVHVRGAFSPRFPEYQMRYMVNALDPAPGVPARAFESGRTDPALFRPVWSNAAYGVYRVVSAYDAADAAARAEAAEAALERGDLREAGRQARAAIAVDPADPRARAALGRAIGLEARGAGRDGASP